MKPLNNKRSIRALGKDFMTVTSAPATLPAAKYSFPPDKTNDELEKMKLDLDLLARKLADLNNHSGISASNTASGGFASVLRSSVDCGRRGYSDETRLQLLETIIARVGELDRLVFALNFKNCLPPPVRYNTMPAIGSSSD